MCLPRHRGTCSQLLHLPLRHLQEPRAQLLWCAPGLSKVLSTGADMCLQSVAVLSLGSITLSRDHQAKLRLLQVKVVCIERPLLHTVDFHLLTRIGTVYLCALTVHTGRSRRRRMQRVRRCSSRATAALRWTAPAAAAPPARTEGSGSWDPHPRAACRPVRAPRRRRRSARTRRQPSASRRRFTSATYCLTGVCSIPTGPSGGPVRAGGGLLQIRAVLQAGPAHELFVY